MNVKIAAAITATTNAIATATTALAFGISATAMNVSAQEPGTDIRTPFEESRAQQQFKAALIDDPKLGVNAAGWLSDIDLYVAVTAGDGNRELAEKVCRMAQRQQVALQIVQVVDAEALRNNRDFEQLANVSCLGAPMLRSAQPMTRPQKSERSEIGPFPATLVS